MRELIKNNNILKKANQQKIHNAKKHHRKVNKVTEKHSQ